MSDNTLVLAMQNGLGAAERVIENLPKDAPRPQVALGVAQGFGASIEAPGEVKYANMRLMRFGETQDGEPGIGETHGLPGRGGGIDRVHDFRQAVGNEHFLDQSDAEQ